ncbi:hypothetical protein QBC40DRAFT_137565, partial [Triangularia verruculosa]
FSSPPKQTTAIFWTNHTLPTRINKQFPQYHTDFPLRHIRPRHLHILHPHTHSPAALPVFCPRQKETISPTIVDYANIHRRKSPSSTMDQSSAAACPKSPSSSTCADADKVKKADDVSSSSCPFTGANAPTSTKCDAPPLDAGVKQDRTLSVDSEDSRRSSTGDVDDPAKPACWK